MSYLEWLEARTDMPGIILYNFLFTLAVLGAIALIYAFVYVGMLAAGIFGAVAGLIPVAAWVAYSYVTYMDEVG